MVQIIEIQNPFEPEKCEYKDLYCTGGRLPEYIAVEGRDVYIDGKCVEQPEKVTPTDEMQILVTPHIAGHGLKRILGFAAMIALSVYSANIAGGLWAKAGSFFAKGAIGSVLASGAVMFLGGKVINAIFPQQSPSLSWNDRQSSQTYGWDLPTPTTVAGNIIGETYGECIPAPQLLEQHVETVNDKQYLNLLYCGGYGQVDEIKDIRIDYTDISNFNEVQIETRLGTNDQKPISFFKNTPLDQSVGIELLKDSVISRTSDSTKATALDVTLEWPAGLYHMNDNGSYGNATVKLRIEYRLRGETNWNNFHRNSDDYVYEVTGATNEVLRRTFSVTGLTAGQYEVRVSMVDKPSTSRYQSMTQWSILTSYVDGIYCRPGKVLVALRIKASNQLSGGVPSLNWRQVRKTVWVHNPETDTYEEKPADNPIWATYDILHGCRRLKNVHTGAYEFTVAGYPADCLDAYYEQWTEAAAYADEEITNQDGEKEPRFRFDAFYDTSQKRWNAAQKAANVGHAAIIPHGRNIGIVVDKPGQITQVFGEGRTTVSSVKGSFSATADRAKAIEITYNDGQNDFKNTVMTVRSPNYNTDHASDNTSQMTLFGVKRRSQAYREAITALATNERQLQFIELSADIDAIVAEYGDIVGYNHTVSRIGIASGRIRAATETTVRLDKAVTMVYGKDYEIYITLSDDTVVKRQVVAKAGTVDTITVSVPFDEVPQTFDTYAFGETDKAVKPFRIVNASRDGDMLVSLKLAEYDEAMYSTELDYSRYPVIDYSNSPTAATVKAVTAKEQSYLNGRSSVSDILVNWTLSGGTPPDSYTVDCISRDSVFTQTINTRMTSCLFHAVKPGETYDIIVHSVLDAVTIGNTATYIHVAGHAVPGENVSHLTAMPVVGGLRLTWSPTDESGAVGYNVYRGAKGADLSKCELIAKGITGMVLDDPRDSVGEWQYYVSAVSSSGALMGNAVTTLGQVTAPGAVKGATARSIYRRYNDGSAGYDIVVEYALPQDDVTTSAICYYKTNAVSMTEIGTIPEGLAGDETGYGADWRIAGESADRTVISGGQIGDTYKLKLVSKSKYGYASPNPVNISITVEPRTEVPNTPQNFSYDFSLSSGFRFAWDDVANADVDFYELRYDQTPGATAGLIARVQGAGAMISTLSRRNATVYLYAHNSAKLYSYPALLSYDLPKPDAPKSITFASIPRGVRITCPSFTSPIQCIRLYITGESSSDVIDTNNSSYAYYGSPGIYSVRATYIDLIGEGYSSTEYMATIKATFDPAWISEESIGLKNIDDTLKSSLKDAQTAISGINEEITGLKQTDSELYNVIKQTKTDMESDISKVDQKADSISATVQNQKKEIDGTISGLSSRIRQHANSITNIVTELGKSPDKSSYSAITQLLNGINLRVKKEEIINQINMTPSGTTIDGKYLHITGTTKIDNDVIVGGMIKAGSVTADKLSAGTIALSNNQGIQGGNVILSTNGMTCTDSKGTTIQFGQDGMVSKDKNGNSFAILSQCMMGVAKNGKYIKFNNPWTETPVVIITPQNVQTNNPAYSTSQVRLHCYAEDVSVNGFRVRAYSGIANGSGSFAQYQECGSMSWTIWRDNVAAGNMRLPYGSRSITFTVKMPSNASRVVFHGRFGMHLSYKYRNFVRFPNSASQNISIRCNGKETYNGMFFSGANNNEIHGSTGNHNIDEYCSYTSNAFTVAQGSDLTCTLTLNPWTEHDGDGSDGLRVWLIIDSLDVYVDGEQILDNDGTGAFFVVNSSNGLYTITD
nr:MAG TPA: tail protein [Caudoviricetes sp.]